MCCVVCELDCKKLTLDLSPFYANGDKLKRENFRFQSSDILELIYGSQARFQSLLG
jgi:hypothetical protein